MLLYPEIPHLDLLIYPDKLNGEDLIQPQHSERWKYTYLHGKLESKSGFDCFNVVGLPTHKGIYTAEVVWPSGHEYVLNQVTIVNEL